ncbi:MAG: hypothetical protein ABIH70_09685 [Chloroflexota bacterium]
MDTIKHTNSGKAKPFKGSGMKGESLFHTFIINVVARELEVISANYGKRLSYISKAKDDRLLAVAGALAVEDALDSLLIAYIPKYKILKDNKDITFAIKTDLMRSLKLIPAHLLRAVEVIRKIRNEFAHELHIDHFDLISTRNKDELTRIFIELHPEDDANSYVLSRMFGTIISGLLACFGAYASNLRLAREYIYSEDFQGQIREIIKAT